MRPPPYAVLACTLACLAAAAACRSERGASSGATRINQNAEPPRRIISLIPSATETIVALGAADRLVARTSFDVDPALAHLPSVGDGLTPSLELLTTLEPDLVVAWPDNASRSVIGRLEDFGVRIYSPQVQSLADLRQATEELGDILGLEHGADSLVASIDAALNAIRAAVAGLEKPGVFYVVWYDPPTTTGSGTYIDQLIEIAGGRNIFADAPGLWPQVSMEEVVRRQPDIVLLSQTDEGPIDVEKLESAVGWRDLRAVRGGYVVQVEADLYNRPGPRVAEAARRLATLLHPDAAGRLAQ
ncbi:MAG: cobalamin-binding protein [Gemmatimonadales bacterium]